MLRDFAGGNLAGNRYFPISLITSLLVLFVCVLLWTESGTRIVATGCKAVVVQPTDTVEGNTSLADNQIPDQEDDANPKIDTETPPPPLSELPIFIINLKDRKEKLELILSRTNTTKPTPIVIEAVDGRELQPSNSSLTRGEVACFRSHIKALRQFLETDYPYGLVLEDDANIELPRNFSAIKKIVAEAPPDWGAISLGINYEWMPPDSIKITEQLYRLNGGILLGTHAILYQRKTAEYLIADQQWVERWTKPAAWHTVPYDLWLARPRKGADIYFVKPALVTQTIKGSDTQGFQKRMKF